MRVILILTNGAILSSVTSPTIPPGKLAKAISLALVSALSLAACSASQSSESSASTASESPSATASATESASLKSRIAITHEGGIAVLDATTLQPIENIDAEGFLRLNPTGNGRYLSVSTAQGFELLDLGTWEEPHGDHSHYFTATPQLRGVLVAAEKPGHAIPHNGSVTFFDDATGSATTYDSAQFTAIENLAAAEPTFQYKAPEAHHGLAVRLNDSSLIVSEGNSESRSTVKHIASDGSVIAQTTQCTGVHGEAISQAEAVVVGCEDGPVVFSNQTVTKVSIPDAYGRIGNLAGSDVSPVVLGDYKTDKDAELERPTRISLTNAASKTVQIVDLPASYSFRSLARSEEGDALVLGTDGKIHVIDPLTGAITASIPVIDPWEEPTQWQEPRPTILALEGSIYVTDPATSRLLAVDLETQKIWNEATLEFVPNEIAGGTGLVPVSVADSDEGAHSHDHSDSEHDQSGHEDHGHEEHGHSEHEHN